MNLADLSKQERAELEADKLACLIRHKCGHLPGPDRQLCAKRMLNGHPEDQRERIKAAMARRAGR